MKVKIIPGINNSDSNHWQSIWELRYGFTRVNQSDWDYPQYNDWESNLIENLESDNDKDNIIVAHSLGCLLTVKALPKIRQYVRGIFLVAPPDPKGNNFPKTANSFDSIPNSDLGIPGILIYSEDDQYSSTSFSIEQGNKWGLEVIFIGKKGHINSKSGLGNWDEGYSMLQKLINSCKPSV